MHALQPTAARTLRPISITTLDGSDLEYVDNYKYLGVWLDCNLSFQTHIKHLQSKIKSRNRLPILQQSLLYSCCQTYPRKTDYPTDRWKLSVNWMIRIFCPETYNCMELIRMYEIIINKCVVLVRIGVKQYAFMVF